MILPAVLVALLLVALGLLVVAGVRIERLIAEAEATEHSKCIALVAHYVGDNFAAQVLRSAAEDWDDPKGRALQSRLARTVYKPGGPSMPSLWLNHRADKLVEEGK